MDNITLINKGVTSVVASSKSKLNKLNDVANGLKLTSMKRLDIKKVNDYIVGNVKKHLYLGKDPSSILTYIPNINLTDLIRNPKEYGKRKVKILERVVRGRGKNMIIRIMDDVLNKKEEFKIRDYVQDRDDNLKQLIEENTPVLNDPSVTDLGGNALRHYLRLYAKNDQGEFEFIDGHAIIKLSETKNILMTKVEGRDLTRKEYISGGDYMITITGKIASPYPDVYPTEDVVKLRNILKHKDVIFCESPFLNIFEIPTLIVLSYDFPLRAGFSNVQEYTINAVYEKTLEALKYETRNVNEILSAKEIMQKEIEEREQLLEIDKNSINNRTSNVTIKDLLNKLNPKDFVQQQSWI